MISARTCRGRRGRRGRRIRCAAGRWGVDSAFVFAFALHGYPHRPDGDPRDDLDLASYGVVKMLDGRRGETYPDMCWEPKAASAALASYYGKR
jgi:hypothetical protein